MSERKEMGNLFGQDPEEPMETEQTEQVLAATGNSSNPALNNFTNHHTSAEEMRQVEASHMSQDTLLNSDRTMDVQEQHQYTKGGSRNPAQNIYTNPHPADEQSPQTYQKQSVNMPTQGQHPNAPGECFNPAQNNSPDLSPSAGQFPKVPQDTAMNTCSQQVSKDEVRAILSVQWSDDDKLQKKKMTLQKVLQTLVSKSKFNGNCDVLNVSEDGRAEIMIKPAAAVSELKEILGKPMTGKDRKTVTGKDRKTVTITVVSMTLPELDIQTPDKAPMTRPPSSVSEPQHVRGQFGEQSDTAPSSPNVTVHTDNALMTCPPSSVSEPQNVSGQFGEQSDTAPSSRNVTVHTDNALMTRPPSSVSEPQNVKGKHREQSDMTTTNALKPTDNDNSQQVNRSSSSVSEKQNDQEPTVEQSGSSSSAAVSTTACCVLPVVHFWYVNHIFKEDIKHIERRHGVKMTAEVNVTFVGNQKDEGLTEAQSEFIDLVQKHLGDFDGSVTPLKSVDTEEFKDALKMIQRPENKLLVALSSEEMSIYGPKPIPTAISKSLNAAPTSLANTYNSAAESQVTSLNIGMSINDRLVNNGLTMQESHWKLMTTSFSDDVDKIKKKFSVDFKDSGVPHGKVNVKVHYKRSGGNTSMESHAVRALLHLCQKIATSPKNITQLQGATGFSGSTKNSSSSSEGASSGPVANSQSEYSTRKTEDSTREGATAGDKEDEKCPICIDTFKNKKQLKCKHEFCKECLEESKKHSGPVCPVCKDVFGVIEGTQPDGTMSSYESTLSLPGFKDCGTIVIDYHFPSGKQTERHPNPGQRYHGTRRTAYLPDNKEGKEVLRLLKKAFNQKLIFTVGTSTTTGIENQVTWNDIHHKTSTSGGPQSFGYPDPDYLRRVRDELKAKGIE